MILRAEVVSGGGKVTVGSDCFASSGGGESGGGISKGRETGSCLFASTSGEGGLEARSSDHGLWVK